MSASLFKMCIIGVEEAVVYIESLGENKNESYHFVDAFNMIYQLMKTKFYVFKNKYYSSKN